MGADDGTPGALVRVRRRAFLAGAGGVALAAALGALPRALAERGWLEAAAATELDLTRDTINGLVAFVTPGDDEYSVAQGVTTRGPGGIAAGATPALIATLDGLVPAPLVGSTTGTTLPASGGVAQLLNGYAAQVDPGASGGGFPSPFARLSFEQKVEVFRRLQSEPSFAGTPMALLAIVLLGLVATMAFSEAPVMDDPPPRRVPFGWELSGYTAPSDGWDELEGYWRGRRAARGAHRAIGHRHRRGRRLRRRRVARRARRA